MYFKFINVQMFKLYKLYFPIYYR